jgi:hypothetical protein
MKDFVRTLLTPDDPPPDNGRRGVLAVPAPLTSSELEAKYVHYHKSLEANWPVPFFDDGGNLEPLVRNDVAALTRIGVTPEEWEMIILQDQIEELERQSHDKLP